MARISARTESIRNFILEYVEKSEDDVCRAVALKFGITRQAAHKHLKKMTDAGCLSESGHTRNRTYKLATLSEVNWRYEIVQGLAEDVAWRADIKPALGHLPDNVLNIWNHGFTEMFNNAVDHSTGKYIHVKITKTAAITEMLLWDDGIGIFKKIQQVFNLLDERHSVLELAKGKLTTDRKNHTGEGIFFTSRMFDDFYILSGEVFFSHSFGEVEDWILQQLKNTSGTFVWMRLSNHTARTTKMIFDQYTSGTPGEEMEFSKTVVPVRLSQYGNDELVSRSQAKRLLARVELFKVVILDFTGVLTIGQAFADEIFRVFVLKHPEIEITATNASSEITQMIERARSVKL